jgi:hypothetical protein
MDHAGGSKLTIYFWISAFKAFGALVLLMFGAIVRTFNLYVLLTFFHFPLSKRHHTSGQKQYSLQYINSPQGCQNYLAFTSDSRSRSFVPLRGIE